MIELNKLISIMIPCYEMKRYRDKPIKIDDKLLKCAK